MKQWVAFFMKLYLQLLAERKWQPFRFLQPTKDFTLETRERKAPYRRGYYVHILVIANCSQVFRKFIIALV